MLLLLAPWLLAGCKGKAPAPAQQGVTYVYHIRGIIERLPVPDQGPPSLMIKMEAVPNWVDIDGKVRPMMAMTMPCQLAGGVSAENLHVGEKVAFTYKVNYTQAEMLVTHIKPLPPHTLLHFSPMKMK